MPRNTTSKPAGKPRPETDLDRARRKRAAIKPNKDWMKVVGMLPDDEFEREAWALGEAWRKAQNGP